MLVLAALTTALCPGTDDKVTVPSWHPRVPPAPSALAKYEAAVRKLDWDAVRADLKTLFKESQDSWPADYGNYAPFFVRLAWHCSGSYRLSDGRGGCEGGRQRFDPERSWADNANLDKARGLLWPIKKKYGLGLSWGDAFILAGTTAVESMGGPTLGFCAGRVDDADGTASLPLGPSAEQVKDWPCAVNGTCTSPLGSTTIGLIYLNPEGPMGQPHPEGSHGEIRDTFARMSMNDSETVALIGGGHAFGKAHGACPAGPGPSPREDPANPWPGACGTGKGADAFTAGFEGPWTTHPTRWDNTYFQNLLSHKWAVHKGPGGHWQWKVSGEASPTAPGPQGGRQAIMMMTSDVSLLHDTTYKSLVGTYAKDHSAFDHAWIHAWYKLTTRDTGPVTRCVGDRVPPPQPWQFPLPPTPATLPNFTLVADAVRKIVHMPNATSPGADTGSTAGMLLQLAWRCAATYRSTDYRGGCSGARIRFTPEASWPANAGWSSHALKLLAPVHTKFASEHLSWADLIVLAGSVAVEETGGPKLMASFCGGRTDATDGTGSSYLEPKLSEDVRTDSIDDVIETYTLLNLSPKEYVALIGGVRSVGPHLRTGFKGAATTTPATFDTEFFSNIADYSWAQYTVPTTGAVEFKAVGKELYAMPSDLLMRDEPMLMAHVQDFAADPTDFGNAFASAWHKMVNAERFDGPAKRVC